MADQTADDHIKRMAELASNRSQIEAQWAQVKKVAAPDAGGSPTNSIGSGASKSAQQPHAANRSKDIYDVTAMNAIDRLSSGIEALVCPQAEYWHGLSMEGRFMTRKRSTDEEKLWLEDQRNLMFSLRYDADSGFVPAVQTDCRGRGLNRPPPETRTEPMHEGQKNSP